jgi:hypothetical protein
MHMPCVFALERRRHLCSLSSESIRRPPSWQVQSCAGTGEIVMCWLWNRSKTWQLSTRRGWSAFLAEIKCDLQRAGDEAMAVFLMDGLGCCRSGSFLNVCKQARIEIVLFLPKRSNTQKRHSLASRLVVHAHSFTWFSFSSCLISAD